MVLRFYSILIGGYEKGFESNRVRGLRIFCVVDWPVFWQNSAPWALKPISITAKCCENALLCITINQIHRNAFVMTIPDCTSTAWYHNSMRVDRIQYRRWNSRKEISRSLVEQTP